MKSRTAIVMTVKNPGVSIHSFIKYHTTIGFEHIYIFFDDPADPWLDSIGSNDNITIIKSDETLKEQWKQSSLYPEFSTYADSQIMARQQLNVEIAIRLATERGIHWLLHIDVDELFYPIGTDVQTHFSTMSDRNIFMASYINHEALPESGDINDYFREVTLFKLNLEVLKSRNIDPKSSWLHGRQYFNAYGNGKSAVNLCFMGGALPNGVHEFRPKKHGPANRMNCTNPAILHYPNCGLDHYINKYKIRGKFPDTWFGRDSIKNFIGSFHLTSRDVIAGDDTENIRTLYNEQIMLSDKNIISTLISRGILERITSPSELLNRDSSGLT